MGSPHFYETFAPLLTPVLTRAFEVINYSLSFTFMSPDRSHTQTGERPLDMRQLQTHLSIKCGFEAIL